MIRVIFPHQPIMVIPPWKLSTLRPGNWPSDRNEGQHSVCACPWQTRLINHAHPLDGGPEYYSLRDGWWALDCISNTSNGFNTTLWKYFESIMTFQAWLHSWLDIFEQWTVDVPYGQEVLFPLSNSCPKYCCPWLLGHSGPPEGGW